MKKFDFKIIKKSKESEFLRLGRIKTPHGIIHTPNFVPVATRAALRGMLFPEAKKRGLEVAIVNTYHLWTTGAYQIIYKFGGLHRFINFKIPLMTDSGGFQVFSFGFSREHGIGKIGSIFTGEKFLNDKNFSFDPKKNLVKITDEGVFFKEEKSGDKMYLTPEKSVEIQKMLGADLIFAFDECTSPLNDYAYTKRALERTNRWAVRSLRAFGENQNQAMFGIIQGGAFRDLRKESVKFISSLPFFGFGIGGPLGKSKDEMKEILNWVIPDLTEKKPRHLLGIGGIDDIFSAVELGVDLMDCVFPTRLARHGTGFTFSGRLNLENRKNLNDKSPIDVSCNCYVCKNYSRSYIAHLLRSKEVNGIILLTHHNLIWMFNLMKMIRQSIKTNSFLDLKKSVLKKY
jgi:queuine tRNA-ribosyltransferase/7-cyano-7-deazaguanine tRNA-ribosyltransferase